MKTVVIAKILRNSLLFLLRLTKQEVLQIAVKRAFQGQGLAQQLPAQLPDQKEVFLEVRVSNQPAQGLYKKNAF